MFKTVILALALLVPASAYAQDPLAGLEGDGTIVVEELNEGSKLPTGMPCEVEGTRYQCFTLDEMKELLMLENELRYFETNYIQIFKKASLLEGENRLLKVQLFSVEEQLSVMTLDRERIFLKWEEENKLRLKAENKPNFGNPIAWGIVGVEASVIIGLILGMVLSG
jgi:hypothetical protein